MNDIPRESIRNISIIGDHGDGKTSLIEGMLFIGGSTDKLGNVDDGSSNLDYESEEKNRKMSINSHIAYYEWNNHLINIVDTPGFTNFLFEAESSIKVVDSVVVVISAVSGLRTQLRRFWQMATDSGLPRVLFMNKLDKERANFVSTITDIEKDLQIRTTPLTIPIGKEQDLKGVVDLIEMKAYIYEGDGKYSTEDVPNDSQEQANSIREKIIESIAETDDELLEKYLDGETFDNETIYTKMREGIISQKIIPLYAGSAIKLIGLNLIMDGINRYLPSPVEISPLNITDSEGKSGELHPKLEETTSAYIFKTISD
ncbi:MAG: GTP-binding protein, partial [Thermodesulfobacteriota bacterium]